MIRRPILSITLGTLVLASCAGKIPPPQDEPPSSGHAHAVQASPSSPAVPSTIEHASASDVPLFDGLGVHRRAITTSSPEAQRYFDQGLAFVYAFNHDEASRAFTRAAALDPACAMAFWGIALANGPHINNPTMDAEHAEVAFKAIARAVSLASQASEPEQALIQALAKRYALPAPADRAPLDIAYGEAMRAVRKAHPEDADIGALFVEALMDLRPWDLWRPDGQPHPGTEEIVAVLEDVLAKDPNHPLALHLYIHATEASLHPDKAASAADRLRTLQPALGHMLHMPSHTDVRLGLWAKAIEANERAIEADRRYLEVAPKQGFYWTYMLHNQHMLAFAAMMIGQSNKALAMLRTIPEALPAELVRDNAAMIDGYIGMPVEGLMRFGRWDEILATPEPPEDFPLARALRLYARGVAYAAKHDPKSGRLEEKQFLEAKEKVPSNRTFGNNRAHDLLLVAEHMLAGELAVSEGRMDAGITQLRAAAKAEDRLRYDEPPDWLQPTRHALGAALLRAGKKAEAEAVYREDLAQRPNNGWSLHGLARALSLQGKKAEAAKTQQAFEQAWKDADFKLTSSCHCIPGV